MRITSINGIPMGTGADYRAGFLLSRLPNLPPGKISSTSRAGRFPLVSGVRYDDGERLPLQIIIQGADIAGLTGALLHALDPLQGAIRIEAVLDGGETAYLSAWCEAIQPASGQPHPPRVFIATLRLDGDARWRAMSESNEAWMVSASGDEHTLTNSGQDDSYPVIDLKPTTGVGGYPYRRWVSIVWRSERASDAAWVRIVLDTTGLISDGKVRADGNDLRILVDGIERDRWLTGINTTETALWVAIPFQPAITMQLREGIAAGDAITQVAVESIPSTLPEAGLVLIGNEVMSYTSLNRGEGLLLGITRAAKGTTASDHTAGDAVQWLQHEVWIVYGDAGADAPAVDERLAPPFDITASTQTTLTYERFGDADEIAPWRWRRWGPLTLSGRYGCYSESQRSGIGSPYEVIGAWAETWDVAGWYVALPIGIIGVSWENGLAWRGGSEFAALCRHWSRANRSWVEHYAVPSPGSVDTWAAWSASASFSAADRVELRVQFAHDHAVEAGRVALTLKADEVPAITVGPELDTYTMAVTLRNLTTGERIGITLPIDVGDTLRIDCLERTATLLSDGSRQMGALDVPTDQAEWMTLAPGANVIRYEATDTGTVAITVRWVRRWYT